MTTRKFFHPGRQPQAHFMTGGRFYTALVRAYGDDGVTLECDQARDLGPGQVLTGVHLDKYGQTFPAPDLRISSVADGTGGRRIDARVAGNDRAGRLFRILTDIENPGRDLDRRQADPGSIPRFTRQQHYTPEAVQARVRWAEQVSGTRLDHLVRNSLKPEALAGNIENYVGAVQIPVGLAGPVLVRGVYANCHVPVPIATTEGALISSISRGAAACNEAGGIQVHIQRQTMLRAPVFFCRDMDGAVNLEHWLHDHVDALRAEAESVSSVARLQEIRTHVFDNTLHVQFFYATGDASGQNMTSACTWMACRWIKKQVRQDAAIGLQSYMVEGNMSGDKKANHQNFSLGRGVAVTATCRIPGDILRQRLRVSPEQYVQGLQAGEVGALQAGILGSNINFANVVAGVFAATGQDLACVHESAAGYFKMRQDGDAVVVSAYLPALVIGTVGGGTKLPTQKECLKLMGCYGNGRMFRMAEIVGAACLALDLSTGAAVVGNEFVHAHEHFGRNRPRKHLSWAMIDNSFFSDLLDDDRSVVHAFERRDLDTGNAILSQVAREETPGVRGLFRFRLALSSDQGQRKLDTVLKIKPPGSELVEIGTRVARLTGEDTLSGLFESQARIFNLEQSNVREIELYREAAARMRPYLPRIYGTRSDHRRRFYAILMEDLSACSHLNTVDSPECWENRQIEAVLAALAEIHAVHWNQRDSVSSTVPLETLNADAYRASADLLGELTAFNAFRYPQLMDADLQRILNETLADLDGLTGAMLQQPLTLTHNDFNPRNICLRNNGDAPQPLVYDWELALFGNPQHDLIEFLVYVLDLDAPLSRFDGYVDTYCRHLEARTGSPLATAEFRQGLAPNALDLALVRFNLYLMGHNLLNFSFLPRVYRNLARYIHHAMSGGK